MTIYKSDKLRNVVLLGHGGSGKTSLAEAMLFNTGAVNRLGRVDEGVEGARGDLQRVAGLDPGQVAHVPIPRSEKLPAS